MVLVMLATLPDKTAISPKKIPLTFGLLTHYNLSDELVLLVFGFVAIFYNNIFGIPY